MNIIKPKLDSYFHFQNYGSDSFQLTSFALSSEQQIQMNFAFISGDETFRELQLYASLSSFKGVENKAFLMLNKINELRKTNFHTNERIRYSNFQPHSITYNKPRVRRCHYLYNSL